MAERGYYNGPYMGVGETDPVRCLHAKIEDTVVDGVTYTLRVSHETSGSAAAGIGVGIEYTAEDLYGSIVTLATTEAEDTDPTSGYSKSDFIIKTYYDDPAGGSLGLHESVRIKSIGTLNLSSVVNAGVDTDKFLVQDSAGDVDFRTGAEVAIDIGVYPSLGLTSGYIPYYDGIALADSPIFNYGGDVGIGTDSPLGNIDSSYGGISLVIGADTGLSTRTDDTDKIGTIVSPQYDIDEELFCNLHSISNTVYNSLYFGGGASGLNAATNMHFYAAANNTTLVGSLQMAIYNSGVIAYNDVKIDSNSKKIYFGEDANASVYYNGINLVFDSQEDGTGDFLFTTGDVGVGVTPDTRVHIQQEDAINDSVSYVLKLEHVTTGSAVAGIGVGMVFSVEDNYGSLETLAAIETVNSDPVGGYNKGDLIFQTYYDDIAAALGLREVVRVTSVGNVGIGTDSPLGKLHINGNGVVRSRVESDDNDAVVDIIGNGYTSVLTTLSTGKLEIYTGAGNLMTLNKNGGGIVTFGNFLSYDGAVNEGMQLNSSNNMYVRSDNTIGSNVPYTLMLIDNTAMGEGVGGAIAFKGNYHTNPYSTIFGGIRCVKANVNNSDYSSKMIFTTRKTGASCVDRVWIDEDGDTGIGTELPLGKLDISYGGTSFFLGADIAAGTRTNSTTKSFSVAMPHYTNAEEGVCALKGVAASAFNLLYVGGGDTGLNTFNQILFNTAVAPNTLTGTTRMKLTDSTFEIYEHVFLTNLRSGATKAAAGAATDELWVTNGHSTLPDGVVMIGV